MAARGTGCRALLHISTTPPLFCVAELWPHLQKQVVASSVRTRRTHRRVLSLLANGVAGGCGDGDFAVGISGDGVAAFFEPVVPGASG